MSCIVCQKEVSGDTCTFCGTPVSAVVVKENRIEDAVSITYKAGAETWKVNGCISEKVFQRKRIA